MAFGAVSDFVSPLVIIAWAIDDGKELRMYLTQRYATSMVFLSLLLSADLNVLFNSAGVTNAMRNSLQEEQYTTISFWAGLFIIVSAILSLLSLLSTFTAWTMVSAVSAENIHSIFRSSIGQYVAELPGRFIIGATYSFLVWICLFFFLLLPAGFWSASLLILALGLFVHTIAAFSAFGRVIMHTGAMSPNKIFEKGYEMNLLPHSLHRLLVIKARANLSSETSIRRQYMSNVKPIARHLSEDEMSGHLNDLVSSESSYFEMKQNEPGFQNVIPAPMVRKRTESLVKFADGFDTNGDRVDMRPASERSASSGLSIDPPPPPPAARPPKRPQRQSTGASPIVLASKFAFVGQINDAQQSVSSSAAMDNDFTERWLNSPSNSQVDLVSTVGGNVLEVDNPYLLHESRSPLRDGTSGSLDLSDDEMFEQQYGDLFDPDDSNNDEEKQYLLNENCSERVEYEAIRRDHVKAGNERPSSPRPSRKGD
jgi:hypothetical protein